MIDLSAHIPIVAQPQPGKFGLGQIVATQGAIAEVPLKEMQTAISRHHRGDWGELDQEDLQANEQGLLLDLRLFSVYSTNTDVRFYVITEHDRSITTIMLPHEY